MILLAVTILLCGLAGGLLLLYVLLSAVAAGERRAAIARMRREAERRAREEKMRDKRARTRYVPIDYVGKSGTYHFIRPSRCPLPTTPSSPPQASKRTPQS